MSFSFSQLVAAFAAAGGAGALGTVIGWSAPTMNRIATGELGFSVSKEEFSWVGSLMTVGAAIQCLPTGWLADKLGRKGSMQVMLPIMVIGWLLTIFASCVEMLYVSRFILGITGGSFCILAPMYIAEIAEKSIRGVLCTVFQMLLVSGILAAYVIGAVLTVKVFSFICLIIPVIFFILLLFVPESPIYAAKKGNMENATSALRSLRPDGYDVDGEVAALKASVSGEEKKENICTAFKSKPTRKAIMITVVLMLIQQFAGINAIIFYANDIFREAKTGIDADLSAILIGLINFLATIVAVILIDKAGRVFLLLISIVVQMFSSIGMMIYFMFKEQNKPTDDLTWLPLTSMCLFIAFFAVGLGPVAWVMTGELFLAEMKGVVGPFAGLTSWGCAFIITKAFVNVVAILGTSGAFAVFAVVAALGLLFVWFCVPETKGKSLNEIQDMLQ